MCGRFALGLPPASIAEYFQLDEIPDLQPRYNIAPTQPAAGIVMNREHSKRVLKMFRWGLIPAWSKDPKIGSRLINARAETIAEKPAFRSAFKYRRCLIPATGFYEWKRNGRKTQPFFIKMLDDKPFAFAGLWEHWKGDTEGEIESCTILTTEPNDIIRPVHNRMPVILDPGDYNQWLDPATTKKELLEHLLKPYPAYQMTGYTVSAYVNNPQNKDSRCVERSMNDER